MHSNHINNILFFHFTASARPPAQNNRLLKPTELLTYLAKWEFCGFSFVYSQSGALILTALMTGHTPTIALVNCRLVPRRPATSLLGSRLNNGSLRCAIRLDERVSPEVHECE